MLKKVEFLTNLAIIIVAILLAWVLIKSYLWPHNTLQGSARNAAAIQQQIDIGEKINLPGVDWQKNGKTLLLALSTTCHFCTESAPFYQRLVKEHGSTQLVALVPQQADEGRQYLKKLGIEINEVRQVSLSAIGLSGTPALILINESGKVANIWIGALSPDKENEILNQVRSQHTSK